MTEQEYIAAAEQHLDMVYRIALNWFRCPADAEDAAQNVMLRLWRTETDFQSGEHLRHWLARVTVNECKRLSMRPWRKRDVSLEECAEPVFEDREKRELYQAVMDLPGEYRVPLYLYYYEGYAVDEVGEILGLKTSTIHTQYNTWEPENWNYLVPQFGEDTLEYEAYTMSNGIETLIFKDTYKTVSRWGYSFTDERCFASFVKDNICYMLGVSVRNNLGEISEVNALELTKEILDAYE